MKVKDTSYVNYKINSVLGKVSDSESGTDTSTVAYSDSDIE